MSDHEEKLDVLMPPLGESVREGLLARWLKQPGDRVREGEPLCEVETDKVSLEIPAPASGVLVAHLVDEQTSHLPGTRMATLALTTEHADVRVARPPAPAPASPPPTPGPARTSPTPRSDARTLVVIGGGLAGFAVARRAGALGRRVVLIDEREALGGYELHEGCYLRAPWLDAARRVAEARQDLAPRGLRCSVELDFATLRAHAEGSLLVWQRGLAFLARQLGVTPRKGRARWIETGAVELGDERLDDVDVVLAQGPALATPAGVALDGERVARLGRAAAFTELPARLLVVGSSPEALEWAGVWQQLGSSVTLARTGPISPDPLLDAKWLRELGRLGMRVEAGPPAAIERVGDEVEARFDDERRARFDRALVEPVPDLAVAPLHVDAGGRTPHARVWAVGGVTGTRWPEEAIAEAWSIAGRIAGDPGWAPLVRETIPHVIHGPVELAWVGPTKAQLAARGVPHVLAGFPALVHLRGRLMPGSRGTSRGFVQVLAHAGSGRVLAAQAMGPGAGELVSEAACAIAMGASVAELGRIPRPLMSWSFGLGEASRVAQGRGLALLLA